MKKNLLLIFISFFGQLTSQNIYTVAGNGTSAYTGNGGPATAAGIAGAFGTAFDKAGNLYIADNGHYVIRKVNTAGIISTVVGNGTQGFSGDGGPATLAKLNGPQAITFDKVGNMYFSDQQINRIRKVDTLGIITTVVGTGFAGFGGDGGPATAAYVFFPSDIIFDTIGNMYIADFGNTVIRKVNTSGIITTIAGNTNMGFAGDGGPALQAKLNQPQNLALDAKGNLYIADHANSRIRKVDVSGIITTVAGSGSVNGSFGGDGGPATSAGLHYPLGINFDATGNMYIADTYNNRIRKVDTSGIITTIAGLGTQAFSGDGGPAAAAELFAPGYVIFDASGNLYISDEDNDRIREITFNGGPLLIKQTSTDRAQISVYPNPTSDQFLIEANTTDKLTVDLYDVNGRHVFSKSISDKSNINVTALNEGLYTLTIKTADRVINKKLVIFR